MKTPFLQFFVSFAHNMEKCPRQKDKSRYPQRVESVRTRAVCTPVFVPIHKVVIITNRSRFEALKNAMNEIGETGYDALQDE